MIEVAGRGDGTYDVRRDAVLGTATVGERRGGPLLHRLEVPAADAADVLEALADALREQGEPRLAVDVRPGDAALEAAVAGRDLSLVAVQMLLDLTHPVDPPARVVLREMSDAEFARYREHLVTSYAQDMVDAGAFADLPDAVVASEQSTRELLPDGASTAGEHLWTAHDDDVPVGILWIHVDGPEGFIYDIEVRPEQRRRGYGREVLDAGAIAARSRGAVRLGLNVFGHNPGARAMYEQAGYDTTELTYRMEL